MNINRPFLKLSVVSILFTTVLLANTTTRGSLRSGDEIVLKPKNQHALSITHTRGMSASNSNYDFIMMNNKDVVYEDKNQKDDVYLVFHDDIEPGDSIKIHINRGFFDYKIARINALPRIVKNVLDDGVLEKAKAYNTRAKKKHKKVHVKRVVQTKVKPRTVTQEKSALPPVEDKVQTVSSPRQQVTHTSTNGSPLSESFFDKFTEIFKGLVKSFSLTPSVKKEQNPMPKKSVETKPIVNKSIKQFDDSALQQAAGMEKRTFTTQSRGLQTTFDDSALQSSASLGKGSFSQTQRGIRENFDDSTLREQSRSEKKSFTQTKEIPQNTFIPAQSEQRYAGRGSIQDKAYHDNLPGQKENLPTFRGVAPVVATPMVSAEKVPVFEPSPIAETPVAEIPAPVVENRVAPAPVYVEPARVQQTEAYEAPKLEAYPDTGYKEGYESLDNSARAPLRERVIEDSSLPSNPVASGDTEEKKLVITKTIDKQEPVGDPYAGRVLGRMDDRVLGNGYDGAASSGKLGMKVTKNNRPVSAWIEVFKNGTKQRVKTFYSNKGRTIKSVNLPAGTYMVRATYRTRDSKQQKTLKNIRLKEGGNIHKSIAFHDGKLRVIARRGDDPLYVKVVAYKSGTRDRVGYDFSSRTSGIAQLSLASGRYDIEVIDHKNNRLFDGIRISGGKTNTINADF